MMKKIFAILFILFIGASLFAAPSKSDVDTFIVKSIVGSAVYEFDSGKFEKLKEGQELTGSVVIKPGLNSVVKISIGEDEFEIKLNNKKYPISYFYSDSKTRKGLKVQSIAKADAVDNAKGVREGVNTASSRASEAKEDLVWEE
jgi:hypothetical protein